MPGAYYNEIDPFSVEWLRHLIQAGLIAPGDVDDRDIRAVHPDDLTPYRQCHFFAGIGGWSHALRLAGWPDDRPVWTGSCPCQPFSVAGRQAGFVDERHLWPGWFHLIEQRRPDAIFGEQVEAAIRLGWLDLVQADLEGLDYTVGAAVLPAAGFGAPHVRHRLYFVAHAEHSRSYRAGGHASQPGSNRQDSGVLVGGGGELWAPGSLADATDIGFGQKCKDTTGFPERGCAQGWAAGSGLRGSLDHDESVVGMAYPDIGNQSRNSGSGPQGNVQGDKRWGRGLEADGNGALGGGVADRAGERCERGEGLPARCIDDRQDAGRHQGIDGSFSLSEASVLGAAHDLLADSPNGQLPQPGRREERRDGDGSDSPVTPASPLAGFWRNADWLLCQDGKWRAVEPGTQPLASGVPARMGRLRGYGNAIVPQVAAAFIESWCEAQEEIGNNY